MSDYDEALAILNSKDGIEAHTNGGGINNDLTVTLGRLQRLTGETIDDVRDCGFSVHSFDTGHPTHHDFTALVLFKESDDE